MKWTEVLGVIASVLAIVMAILAFITWLEKRSLKEKRKRSRSDYILGILFSILCGLLWSIGFTSLSWTTSRADPLEMNVVLLGVASLVYFLVFCISGTISRVILGKQQQAVIPNDSLESSGLWKGVVPWLVVAGNIGNFVLFFYALYFISASQTITLQKTNPIFVAFLGGLFLKKRVSAFAWMTVLLVVLGSVLIASDTSTGQFRFQSGGDLLGSLLALFAGLCFAVFSVGIEKLDWLQRSYQDRFKFLAGVFFVSFVAVLILAYFSRQPATSSPIGLAILVANGVRVALVYLFFCAAVERIGALLTSVWVACEVPLTMLWDSQVFGTIPASSLVIGAIIIVAGGVALVVKDVTPQSE